MNPSDSSGETDLSQIEFTAPPTGTEGTPKTPQELAHDLGPYDPPSKFDHGEEFEPDVPRPIPKSLRKGSYSQRRRSVAIVFAALGSSFAITAPWKIIKTLSYYVLPLTYLGEAGYCMIAIALFIALRNRFSKARFEYVQSGMPFVGRVLSVGEFLTKTINSETKQETITVQPLVVLEYDNPDNGEHEFVSTLSEVNWNQSASSKYKVDVAAGDYVTLVGIPGQIQKTLRLYGFLGLDPKREFILYRGRPQTGTSPFTAILIATAVFACLWMFVGLLYMINYYIPSEWSWSIGLSSMGIGAAAGAILGYIVALIERQGKESNSSVVVVALAFGFFGCIGGLLGMGLINAGFDKSEPKYLPISIVNHWQKTHKMIFREYEIEYNEFGNGKTEKSHVTVEDLGRLGSHKLAVKETRQGALGLEWVRGFHPCIWVPIGENPTAIDQERAVEVDTKKYLLAEFQRMGGQVGEDVIDMITEKQGKTMKLRPVLALPDGSFVSIPNELLERANQDLKGMVN